MSEPPPWDTSGQQDSGQYPAQAPYQGPALPRTAAIRATWRSAALSWPPPQLRPAACPGL